MNRLPLIIFVLTTILSQTVYSKEFTLHWKKEEKSVSYIIEIARDKEFSNIIYHYQPRENLMKLDLPIGDYFIRVAGIDGAGVKSKYTPIREVILRPPFTPSVFPTADKIYVPQNFTLHFLKRNSVKTKLFYKLRNKNFIEYQGKRFWLKKGESQRLAYYYITDGKKSSVETFTLIADVTPPQYKLISDGNIYNNSNLITVKMGSSIEILGEDDLSGIREILYSYNKKEFLLYQGPIDIDDLTPFTLYFKILDRVGNSSPLYEKKVTPIE